MNGEEIDRLQPKDIELERQYFIDLLKVMVLEKSYHPTKFLCEVIQGVYGHKVKLNDLINLIESSEL